MPMTPAQRDLVESALLLFSGRGFAGRALPALEEDVRRRDLRRHWLSRDVSYLHHQPARRCEARQPGTDC